MKRFVDRPKAEDVLNEPLCIKFAAELIEMVARVKENRKSAANVVADPQRPEDIQYFVHTSGVKEFFKQCGGNLRLFLGLSVGQFYHEGSHAAAQVACLQNLRESYEQWIKGYVTRNQAKVDCIERTWNVDLIVADTGQALNRIPPVAIDLGQEEGQCLSLLHHEGLRQFEEEYIQKGNELEKHYSALFSTENHDQEHVQVAFNFSKSPTRWGKLKCYYNDPLFIEMMNYLERCFKLGVKRLIDRKCTAGKFPKEVETNLQSGMYDKWADIVSTNDLAYVNSEIVLLPYVIFNKDRCLGEDEAIALMYRGPMNMILGSGKNILAQRYAGHLTKSSCFYMRCEQVGCTEEKQDKNADLFLGTLDAEGAKVVPDLAHRCRCVAFIEQEAGQARGLEIILDAVRQRETRKEKQAKRELKRIQENFEGSPYFQFLESFHSHVAQYTLALEVFVNEYAWNLKTPIKCILNFFSGFSTSNENSDSPRLRRSNSLTKSTDGLVDMGLEEFLAKIQKLDQKYDLADSEEKQLYYLRRVGCYLVEYAVALRRKMGEQDIRFKRSKSIQSDSPTLARSHFFQKSSDQCIPSSGEVTRTMVRFNSQERVMAGFLYYLQQIITDFPVTISDLKNPDYYPDNRARADYVLTQEALQNSVPGVSSFSQ